MATAGLAGLVLAGCVDKNPSYCDPKEGACATFGQDLAEGQDLGLPADTDLRDSEGKDLRGEDTVDMRRTCRESASCASSVCLPDGSCAPPGDVIYVNNRGGTCMGAHAGTQADPVCTTSAALELAVKTGKKLLQFAGSVAPYDPAQIDGLSLGLFSEPPFGTVTPARIDGGLRSALRLSGPGSVYVSGLDLGGSLTDVVSCQSANAGPMAAVEITRSRIHDSQDLGVFAGRCKLTIRRSAIYSNSKAGVYGDSGSDVLIENTFILYNRGPGVRIPNGSLRLRASTIVNNGFVGTLGGVDCGNTGGSKTIDGSILVDNSMTIGGRQLSLSCKLQNSATDEESFPGGSNNRYKAEPNFIGGTDFRLVRGRGSDACCVDQLDAMTGIGDITVDFEGTPRPQGLRWDIGAHEVK